MKRYIGPGAGKGGEASRGTVLPMPPSVHHPGNSLNQVLLGFDGGSITVMMGLVTGHSVIQPPTSIFIGRK